MMIITIRMGRRIRVLRGILGLRYLCGLSCVARALLRQTSSSTLPRLEALKPIALSDES